MLNLYLKNNNANFWKPLVFVFIYIIITNSFFWVADSVLLTQRPIINIDYFIVVILFFSRFIVLRYLGFFLFLLIFVVDLVFWLRQLFPFIRLGDIFYFLKVFYMGPYVYKIYLLFMIFLYFLEIFSINFSKRFFSIKEVLCSVIFILICFHFFLDKGVDKNMFSKGGFLSSQILNIYNMKDSLMYNKFSWDSEIIPSGFKGATDVLFHQEKRPDRVLLVIVESLGLPHDKVIENFIIEPILNDKTQEKIINFERRGQDFVGATVSAELRELCRANITNFNIKSIQVGWESCLPNQLARNGYKTYGLHAANGAMYDRFFWYPKSGLKNNFFFENFPENTRCYSFPGVCDRDLFPFVSSVFEKNKGKVFFSWMTLNSHYPYDIRDIKKQNIDCSVIGLDSSSDACRLIYLQRQFFEGLAYLVSQESMKGVHVYLVGDHQPPIIDKRYTNIFEENKVLSMTFEIKSR